MAGKWVVKDTEQSAIPKSADTKEIKTRASSNGSVKKASKRKSNGTMEMPNWKRVALSKSEEEWNSGEMISAEDMAAIYCIEEIEGIDVVTETTESGAKLVSFKNVHNNQMVNLVNQPVHELQLNDEEFLPVDEFTEETANDNNDIKPTKRKKNLPISNEENNETIDDDEEESAEISHESEEIPLPSSAWDEFSIDHRLLKKIHEMKFTHPTEIQERVLPIAFSCRKDIIGCAETGSGKTLAYGLPILQALINREKDNCNGAFSLILAPTRELALQIKQHLAQLSSYISIKIMVVVGGMSKEKQERLWNSGPDIIVATPGRLHELIQSNEDYLKYIQRVPYFIIDEADRMLESGHFTELTTLLNIIKKNTATVRRIFLFSATLIQDRKIKSALKTRSGKVKLAPTLEELLKNIPFSGKPEYVNVLPRNSVSKTLLEYSFNCLAKEKEVYLYYFLSQLKLKTIVFVNAIEEIRRLVPIFQLLNVKCFPLHAEMQQRQRLKYLDAFTASMDGVLIASDVAARGLDISIDCVVHYHVPKSADVYIHRSGRTARAGAVGKSIVLTAPEEATTMKRLCNALKKNKIPEMEIDLLMLSKIKETVFVAKEIVDLERATKKEKHNKNWLKKAAMEFEIEMSSAEESEEERNDKERNLQGKVRAMKDKLKGMLNMKLIDSRLRDAFYSGEAYAMDKLLGR